MKNAYQPPFAWKRPFAAGALLLCAMLLPAHRQAIAQHTLPIKDSIHLTLPMVKAQLHRVDSLEASLDTLKHNSPEYPQRIFETAVTIYNSTDKALGLALMARAANLFHQAQDSTQEAWALRNIGVIQKAMGQTAEAMASFAQGLAIARHFPEDKAYIQLLAAIGSIYIVQGAKADALPYLWKGKAVPQHSNLWAEGMYHIYTNLAHYYYTGGQTLAQDSITYYFIKAKELAQAHNLREDIITQSLYNLATNYSRQAQYQESINQLQELIPRLIKPFQQSTLARSYTLLAENQFNLGYYPKAKSTIRRAIPIAEALSNQGLLQYVYNVQQAVLEANGNYKEALMAHRKYKQVSDSLVNEANTREITKLEMNYQFQQERDSLAVAQSAERMQYSLALARKTQLQHIAFAGAALLLLALGIYYRLYAQKKKANVALHTLNEEISQQHDMLARQTHTLEHQAEELNSQNETINKQLKHIQQLGRLRTQLTHMAAHDLKNPLNVVMGLASMPPSPENQTLIHDNSRRMLQLVLNMLDVDKLETEQLTLKPKTLPLELLLQELAPQISTLLKAKNLHYGQEARAYTLQADDSLLLRVLVNLLNNAIKYTPVGGAITLTVSPQGEALRFEVTDTGEGIPPEDLPHIFDKYYQSQRGRKRHSSGLGLTFCQLVVQAHGGQIGAHSTPGQGSTIWFTLPWQPQEEAALKTLALAPNASPVATPALSPQEQEALAPLLPQLQALRVNQLTEAKAALRTVEFNTPGLQQWKEALLEALYACNAASYEAIVNG